MSFFKKTQVLTANRNSFVVFQGGVKLFSSFFKMLPRLPSSFSRRNFFRPSRRSPRPTQRLPTSSRKLYRVSILARSRPISSRRDCAMEPKNPTLGSDSPIKPWLARGGASARPTSAASLTSISRTLRIPRLLPTVSRCT